MCGRFTATFPSYHDLVRALGVPALDEQALLHRPRWNVAPMDRHWVVRLADRPGDDPPTRELVAASWGFLPGAGSGGRPSYPLINARSETVTRLPAFKGAFAKRRCIVPVDGFYEWVGPAKARRPIWFHAPDGDLLRLAGLWEPARGPRAEGAPPWEFTILTTAANDVVAPAHDRMPVVIAASDVDAWLFASDDDRDAKVVPLLRPAPEAALVGMAVSSRANKVGNDDPDCLAPWDPAEAALAAEAAQAAQKARRAASASRPKREVAGGTLPLFGEAAVDASAEASSRADGKVEGAPAAHARRGRRA